MTPVYFHGVPGSPREVALAGLILRDVAPEAQIGPDRHLIGFALGAHRAIVAAVRHGATRLDLIAPGAPLDLGDFLPRMAGRAVFEAARKGRLARLVALQRAMLVLAPRLPLRRVFSGAAPADARLIRPGAARDILTVAFRDQLLGDPAGYRSAIEAYVQPWADLLPRVPCPVRIWHGCADRWAPFDMAEALRDHLPDATLVPLPGLGHHSALVEGLPRILGKTPPRIQRKTPPRILRKTPPRIQREAHQA